MYPSYQNIGRELLYAIREGDKNAFEVFYRMEHDNLLHFISSYTKDPLVSEDIVQDSLLALWEARETLNPTGNLRAFAFTIARNRTLDYLRKRYDTVSLDACLNLEDESLDSLINALDLTRLLENTFEKLPVNIRNTFLRSRRDGLTNREIAAEEGLSIKAIEYRISTALKSLRKIKESF